MTMQKRPNTYEDSESVDIMRECVENRRNLGAVTIAKAAERQGARLKWMTLRDVWAEFDDRRIAINGHAGTESALASGIEADKYLAKELMAAAGIAVPAGRRAASADDAVQAQREIGQPVVIKPVLGVMGRGVTVNVTEPDDVRDGYLRAAKGGAKVLVEQYIDGESEYRAHATPTDCVGVFRRLLPSVTGDGRSTVAELVEAKNEARRLNPATLSSPIPLDAVAEGFLRRRGLTWDSVVPSGEHVVVRDVNGITSGGDSEECLDTVSEDLKRTAVSVVKSIPGMDWGGVDILVERTSDKPYVLEVNTSAAINGSTFPVFGTPRDLGGIVWRKMKVRSTPESVGAPYIPELLQAAHPVGGASTSDAVTLRDLLRWEMQRQGYQLTDHNQGIWSATSPQEPSRWFNSVIGDNDLRTAIEPLRKPLLIRQIMSDQGIPQPVGRQVGSIDELRTFRDEVGTDLTLMPFRMSPYKPAHRYLKLNEEVHEAASGIRRARLAQAWYEGPRFSVIASSDEVLAIVAEPGQKKPAEAVLTDISRRAVSAVRAIPQLRWAVATIVWPFVEQEGAYRRESMLENLLLNPKFKAQSEVISGSMDRVFDVLTH